MNQSTANASGMCSGGHVVLDGSRIDIHTPGGFSAHADQKDLLNFIGRTRTLPRQVRLVHGDEGAKAALAKALQERHPGLVAVFTHWGLFYFP